MDNNSKDTLFGFTAITDVFTDNHDSDVYNVNDDDLSDEELEELKRNSARNTPPTPSKKNKKESDDNDDDNEDHDDDSNKGDDDFKQNKSESKDKDDADDDKKDDDDDNDVDEDDEDDSNSEQVTALFDAIAEEFDWTFEEGEKKPNTVEGLVEYFRDVVKENSVPEYASQEVADLDEFVRNGGRLQDYFKSSGDVDLEKFNIESESNQRKIITMLMSEKGFSEKQIERKLDKYEDAGILEDEAEDALEAMKDITEKKKEKLLEDQKKQRERLLEDQQNFTNSVIGEINAMDNIRGIKVPKEDKKALLTYIFKTDSNGKTQYQKDYVKSVKNLIESAYFTMKGDTLLNTAKKMGKNSAIKELKQSFRSTGTGVSRNKKVNTTSSTSAFSRLAKLLN